MENISIAELRMIIEHSFLAGRNKFVPDELPRSGGLHPSLPSLADWQEARIWSEKLLYARGLK